MLGAMITSPLEVVKTRLQVRTAHTKLHLAKAEEVK